MVVTNAKIVCALNKIESKGLHMTFKSQNKNFWPLVRIYLAFSIIQKRYQSNKSNGFRFNIFALIRSLLHASEYGKFSDCARPLLVSHENYRISVDGKRYDRVLERVKRDYIEEGREFYELDLQTLAVSYSGNGKLVSSMLVSGFMSRVWARIRRTLYPRGLSSLPVICSQVTEVFRDLDPDFVLKPEVVSQQIILHEALTRSFLRTFKALRVSEVIHATYYDADGLAMNAACNLLGIKCSCMQHGGQSRNNPAFGRWLEIPPGGYEMLPDEFLCWDTTSARNVDEWAASTTKHSARVVGYGWADMWLRGDLEFIKSDRLKALSEGQFNVLITLQPSLGFMEDFLSEVIGAFGAEISWWVRIHPRQNRAEALWSLQRALPNNKRIFIKEAGDFPLPAVMANMNLHLTGFSSSVYEAQSMGVTTVFINTAGAEYFPEQIESGAAILVSEIKPLLTVIKEAIKLNSGPKGPLDQRDDVEFL